MANQIQFTRLKSAPSFVGAVSRYADQNVIYYGPNNLLTFDTYHRKSYPVTENDRYMVITKTREYRPDLVSYESYGFVSLWWQIMEANGMKDILEFEAGRNIRLPASLFTA